MRGHYLWNDVWCVHRYIDSVGRCLTSVGLAQARPNKLEECKTLWGELDDTLQN